MARLVDPVIKCFPFFFFFFAIKLVLWSEAMSYGIPDV